MNSINNRVLVIIAALAAITLLTFLPVLEFEFVWDDDALILFNSRIDDIASIPSYFMTSFWNVSEEIQDVSRPFYRPFIMTSYALDHVAWEFNAAGYHFSNILFHIANSILAFFVALRFIRSRAWSFAAALLFALHPVHAENVCWISGRTDLLCAFFFLSGLLMYIAFLDDRISARIALPTTAALYICSLLSKETGVVFPLVVLAMSITHPKKGDRAQTAVALGTMFLTACTYMILRTLILTSTWTLDINLTIGERIAAAFLALSRYLGLFLLMIRPDPHHIDAVPSSALDPAAALAGVALLCYGVAILLSYQRQRRDLAFWLAWPLITLLPVMNIGSFGDVVYADRFLYIPSVGGCILVAYALARLASARIMRIPAVLACALLLATCVQQLTAYMPIWKSNITLFERAVATSPHSAYIFFNLGNSYARDGRHADACRSYAKAITIQENYADATLNMSASLHKLGRHKDAIVLLSDAARKSDKTYERNELLAEQYRREGQHALANASQAKASSLKRMHDHHAMLLQALMADCYRSLGDIPSAILCYSKSLTHAPSYAAYNNLGECLLASGDLTRALGLFKEASQQKGTVEVFNNIGFILIRLNRMAEAGAALTQGEALISNATPPTTEVALLYNQAQVALEDNRAAEARLLLRTAYKAARSHGLSQDILSELETLIKDLSE